MNFPLSTSVGCETLPLQANLYCFNLFRNEHFLYPSLLFPLH